MSEVVREGISYPSTSKYYDWLQGRRDARAAIPAVTRRGDPRPVTTPHREALIHKAEDVFDTEYLHYLETVAEPHRRIVAARAELAACKANLAWAEAEVAVASERPAEAELRRRRLGEEDHPDEVIVERRLREHARDVRQARNAVTRAQEAAEAAEARIAAGLLEAEQHHTAAVARVRRFHAHTHRRLATYRRSLVRLHPHGAWVNAALSRAHPDFPSWAQAGAFDPDEAVPVATAPPPPRPALSRQRDGTMIRLKHATTIFGSRDHGKDHVILDAPIAAAHHFDLSKRADELVLRSRRPGRGPYINGRDMTAAHLRPGDFFDFADRRYTMVNVNLLRDDPLGRCDLIVADAYAVTGDNARLTGMSFVQRERTLLAVLGPSGAGKSSLFEALLGELPLQSGRLYFQDTLLEGQTAQIRDKLGFVPQEVLLHQTLTVRKVLEYAFRLRSPAPMTVFESQMDKVCERLQLTDQQLPQIVSTLSGGQKRRVSLAIELLTDPKLLMLDEPTTGLDTGLDREVMEIMKEYALSGRTVIIITHSLEHLHNAQQVLVVVKDGKPVYSGEPEFMLGTLNQPDHAGMMLSLADDASVDAEHYQASRTGEAIHQADVLTERLARAPIVSGPARAVVRLSPRVFQRQLTTLIARQWALLLARGRSRNKRHPSPLDTARIWLVTAMPLLIAAVSALVAAAVPEAPGLGEPGPNSGLVALNLLTTLCILSGQALTYSDLISEGPIIRREHRTGVAPLAVTLAKWLVYAAVAVAQAIVITWLFCAIPGRAPTRQLLFSPVVDLMISLSALTVAAMSLGLVISAVAKNLEQAVPIVTIVTITQIAFNGASSDFSQNTLMGLPSLILPDRWGLAATAAATDLRGINGPLMNQDALWRHTRLQWFQDLAALGILSLLFFAVATYLLHRRLAPPRRRDVATWRTRIKTGLFQGQKAAAAQPDGQSRSSEPGSPL